MTAQTKQQIIDAFKVGTEFGDNGYQVVSLSIIRSEDLSGGYKETD